MLLKRTFVQKIRTFNVDEIDYRMRSFFWCTNWENDKQRLAKKFGLNCVGEIEWQNFCQMLCTHEFLLGAQRLVKSKCRKCNE